MHSSDDGWDSDALDNENNGNSTLTAAAVAKAYEWEGMIERTWDTVQEDEDGSLTAAVAGMVERSKRNKRLAKFAIGVFNVQTDIQPSQAAKPFQRGIIRHLLVLLDLSSNMTDKDLRPTRLLLTLSYMRLFIPEFFTQNPIGQLGFLALKDGVAEWIAPMSGNPHDLLAALDLKAKLETSGEPSLMNALETGRNSMTHLPSHGSKEMLLIFGSLTTCDPGDIHNTIRKLAQDRIRVNVIGLCAELKILKDITTSTEGTLGVVMNEDHFKDLLWDIIPPPVVHRTAAQILQPNASNPASDLLEMGFPIKLPPTTHASFCSCHSKLKREGYICPRCSAKLCDIPTDCSVCGLVIVSSTHLARSYHHLFPVPEWTPITIADGPSLSVISCSGCCKNFTLHDPSLRTRPVPTADSVKESAKGASTSGRYKCPKCECQFCSDCDTYVHEVLFSCPGCASIKP